MRDASVPTWYGDIAGYYDRCIRAIRRGGWLSLAAYTVIRELVI